MVFTLWAVIVPFIMLVFCVALQRHAANSSLVALGFFVFGYWCLAGIPLTILYWLARVVRLAWRQGSARDRDAGL